MTTAMPAWLEQQIAERTGITPGTRNTHPTRCSSCGAQTLTGLSDDLLAWVVQVDPSPLTPVGEALAWLRGRRTYALRRQTLRSYRLTPRDRWQIRGTPAGTSGPPLPADVVAEHRCGQPLPSAPSVHQPRPRQGDPDGPAPF